MGRADVERACQVLDGSDRMPADSRCDMPARSTQILATWLIGTDASCDLVVHDPTVSSHHCRLTRYADWFTLEDLGSTNGTFVDEVRMPRPPPDARHAPAARHARTVAPLPWPDDGRRGARREPGVDPHRPIARLRRRARLPDDLLGARADRRRADGAAGDRGSGLEQRHRHERGSEPHDARAARPRTTMSIWDR